MFACKFERKTETISIAVKDNEELKAIYEKDQADRKTENIDWLVVSKRDGLRQIRVSELIDSNKVNTSLDFYNTAMIFQHGNDTIASGMAVKLMRKAIELDSTTNKWLLAAAIDRDLMRKGKPQIYGTQYRKMGDEFWKIYNLDSTKVSDKERIEYNVETLAEQKDKLRIMNKKKLSELLASLKKVDKIIDFIKNENLTKSAYDLTENGINNFGYLLMSQKKNEEALKIFELNIKLYPKAYNTYDSYGECLVKLGKIQEGKKAYEKSLELNPDNKEAERILEEIRRK
ncbi:MAG: hypothetical protein A2X08_03750 [Bacteroidetes bacterium GWA2_32_17]|nr:MAG: hypothetical protein A2X08_03750 [Bacteroidetes bacterium GWA2_32_17]